MLKFLTTIVIIMAAGDVDCGVRSEQNMTKPIYYIVERVKTITGNLNYGNKTNGNKTIFYPFEVKEFFASKPKNTNRNIKTRDKTLHDNRHNNNTDGVKKMIKPLNSEKFKTTAGNLNYGNKTNDNKKNFYPPPVKEFVSKPKNTNRNINTRDETLHDNRYKNNTNDDKKNDSIKIIDSQSNSSDGNSTFNDFHNGYNSTDDDTNVYSALDNDTNDFREISKLQKDVSEIVEAISYLADENEDIRSKLNELTKLNNDIISKYKYRESGDDAKLDSNQDSDNTDNGTLDDFDYGNNSKDDSNQITNSWFPRRSVPLLNQIMMAGSPCVRGEYWNPANRSCLICPNPECKVSKCPPNQRWVKLLKRCLPKGLKRNF